MSNCGTDDNSDETQDCHAYQENGLIYLTIFVSVFICFIAIVVTACIIQQRKNKLNKPQSELNVQYGVPSKTFSSPGPVCKPSYPFNTTKDGRIIKEETEKVSIV
ncbi:hypothetical protein HELRODRAFT_164169 [Helobdella robusta]|uniref:Uncharacterized protein n=1 Tax=Helobdella robusta TaxID=6412 RepID=T1EV13_HELRO|nr:hypothetical protein HELRODRAFT_164169 [Helobdella robusta]ESN94342.1 hypothetical protein HELRODRAFT_164169 [Helobdella robusta]